MRLLKYTSNVSCVQTAELEKIFEITELANYIGIEEFFIEREGKEFFRSANIKGIPTLVLLDNQNIEIDRIEGVPYAQDLINFITR